jgi:hypothetical protein
MISVSDVWAALRDAQREIEALKTENARLREELTAYRDAVRVDVLMEGPRFAGCNTSRLREAWELTRIAAD